MGIDAPGLILIRTGALGDALLTVPLVVQLAQALPDPQDRLIWYQSSWTCGLPWGRILPPTEREVRVESIDSSKLSELYCGNPDLARHRLIWWEDRDLIEVGVTRHTEWFEPCDDSDFFYHWIPAPTIKTQSPPHAAIRLCTENHDPVPNLRADIWQKNLAARLPLNPTAVDLRATWLRNPVPQSDRRADLCLLAPGAGSRKKQLPLDHWLDLAMRQRAMGLCVTWLLGPAEIEGGLPALILRKDPAAELATPTLAELPEVIGRAGRFFGHDSGPSHLAGMLGIETNVFFGPTNPDVWRPLGPKIVIHRFDPTATVPPGEPYR